MSALRAVGQWWDRTWFTPTTRYQYGLFRILLVGGLLVLRFGSWWPDHTFAARAATPAAFTAPSLLLRVFHVPLPLPGGQHLQLLLLTLIALSLVGLATRAALVLLAFLNLYLNAAINSYGFIDHATTLPSLTLLVLAFTPGATDLSLDAWLRARRRGEHRGWAGRWTGFGRPRPRWPALVVIALMSLTYFSGGWSKLHTSGLGWANGQTLAAYASDPNPSPYFLADPQAPDSAARPGGTKLESFLYNTAVATKLARWLGQYGALMAAFATVVLVWEVTFPVVIVAPRLLVAYLAVGVVFHTSVWLMFGLSSFATYIVVYLLFVDWTALGRWVARRRRPVVGEPTMAGTRS